MLSALILTKNEEKNIERCIKSLSFCDEIIIADDNSTDQTVAIAESLNATIVTQLNQLDFAAKRNALLEQSKEDWLLFIDPDEEVTIELANKIKEELKQPKYEVYLIKRRDFFWGKVINHGEVASAVTKGIVRLVKKGSGTWNGKVHETFVSKKPVGELSGYLNHYPHQTLKEFIADVNVYSTLRSKELLHAGYSTSIFEIMFLPLAKFIYTYFFKRGFLDGPAGFAYSFMMSFHSFLVRAKLYQYKNID